MDLLDVLLIVVVPLLSVAGLVIAAYVLVVLGRGVSSLLPSRPGSPADEVGAVGRGEPPWLHAVDEPFPEAARLTALDRQPSSASRHRIEITAQLLFSHLRADGIFVDIVVLKALGSAEDVIAAGAPLSLRVERPGSEVLGACSEAILELWAERGDVVQISLTVQGDDVRAEVTNGDSRVVLDIAEAAGLP